MVRRTRSDAGFSLVEVLIAVVVLGVAGLALLNALQTNILNSGKNSERAVAMLELSAAAQVLTSAPFQSCTGESALPYTRLEASGTDQGAQSAGYLLPQKIKITAVEGLMPIEVGDTRAGKWLSCTNAAWKNSNMISVAQRITIQLVGTEMTRTVTRFYSPSKDIYGGPTGLWSVCLQGSGGWAANVCGQPITVTRLAGSGSLSAQISTSTPGPSANPDVCYVVRPLQSTSTYVTTSPAPTDASPFCGSLMSLVANIASQVPTDSVMESFEIDAYDRNTSAFALPVVLQIALVPPLDFSPKYLEQEQLSTGSKQLLPLGGLISEPVVFSQAGTWPSWLSLSSTGVIRWVQPPATNNASVCTNAVNYVCTVTVKLSQPSVSLASGSLTVEKTLQFMAFPAVRLVQNGQTFIGQVGTNDPVITLNVTGGNGTTPISIVSKTAGITCTGATSCVLTWGSNLTAGTYPVELEITGGGLKAPKTQTVTLRLVQPIKLLTTAQKREQNTASTVQLQAEGGEEGVPIQFAFQSPSSSCPTGRSISGLLLSSAGDLMWSGSSTASTSFACTIKLRLVQGSLSTNVDLSVTLFPQLSLRQQGTVYNGVYATAPSPVVTLNVDGGDGAANISATTDGFSCSGSGSCNLTWPTATAGVRTVSFTLTGDGMVTRTASVTVRIGPKLTTTSGRIEVGQGSLQLRSDTGGASGAVTYTRSGTWPTGVSLSAAGEVTSVSTATAGTYSNVAVQMATADGATSTGTFTLTLFGGLKLTQAGQTFSGNYIFKTPPTTPLILTATGGNGDPITVSTSTPGFSCDSSTANQCSLTWPSASAGINTVTLTLSGGGSISSTATVTVRIGARLTPLTPSLKAEVVNGTPRLTAEGASGVTFASSGTWPTGVTISSNGTIASTASTATGVTQNLTVILTTADGVPSTQTLSILFFKRLTLVQANQSFGGNWSGGFTTTPVLTADGGDGSAVTISTSTPGFSCNSAVAGQCSLSWTGNQSNVPAGAKTVTLNLSGGGATATTATITANIGASLDLVTAKVGAGSITYKLQPNAGGATVTFAKSGTWANGINIGTDGTISATSSVASNLYSGYAVTMTTGGVTSTGTVNIKVYRALAISQTGTFNGVTGYGPGPGVSAVTITDGEGTVYSMSTTSADGITCQSPSSTSCTLTWPTSLAAGSYAVTINGSDGFETVSRNVTLTLYARPAVTVSLPSGVTRLVAGNARSLTVTVTGGVPGIAASISKTSGSEFGALSGSTSGSTMPQLAATAAGTYSVGFAVTGSGLPVGSSVTQSVSLSIVPPLAATRVTGSDNNCGNLGSTSTSAKCNFKLGATSGTGSGVNWFATSPTITGTTATFDIVASVSTSASAVAQTSDITITINRKNGNCSAGTVITLTITLNDKDVSVTNATTTFTRTMTC